MSSKFLYLYVFFTGAAVMGIEMSASRLIAPYFGTSLMVWANIIGIILLAMSAGYFVGGRLADKHPEGKVLFGLSLGAGLLLTIIPLVSQWFFHLLVAGILATPVRIVLLAFAGTLLLFSPPIFLLAMVSPFALRLSAPAAQETGKIAGRLFAFSTLGSLIGTFVPSFWLIPSIGTRATIFISAFVIMALSAWGLKKWWAVLIALLPCLFLFFSPQTVKADQQVLWEKETPYQYVQVIRQEDHSIALVYNEGGGIQSIARPNHGLAPQDYYDYYLALPFFRPQPAPKVWILGSAGGTMLGQFAYWTRQSLPKLTLTGVEIDPDVIPLGKKFFGLTGLEGQIVNADARTFLRAQKTRSDLIIVDAYTQQIYIPFHLSTQEFYKEVDDHLNPGGMLALNINAVSPSSPLLLSFEHTLAGVFPYTYIFPVPDSLNYVLLASNRPVKVPPEPAELPAGLHPFYQALANKLKPVPANSALMLTDDRAPVEFLTDQMIWQTLLKTVTSGSALPDLPDSSGQSGTSTQPDNTVKTDNSSQAYPSASQPDNPANPAGQDTSPGLHSTGTMAAASSGQADRPKESPQEEKALALYERGLKLYYDRNFTSALDLFNQALTLDANCYQALNGKGATYAFQGRYNEGIALIEQALALKPDFVYGHFNLGLAYELAGRWDAAITAYQEAIRLDINDTWSYYGIASIYGRQGNVEKVIEYLKPAIELDSDVKAVARDEKDFAPVRQDPRFQALLQ